MTAPATLNAIINPLSIRFMEGFLMPERLIIKNGKVVSTTDVVVADVLVEGEQIVGIVSSNSVSWEDARSLDATDRYVLPGLVDPHTHIQLDTGVFQTSDNWEIGTRVAAYGGVTTVVDFATQFAGQSFPEALDNRLQEAKPAYIDYSFHMMITDPPQEDDAYAHALEALRDLGVPSVKLYTTYRPNYYMDDAALLRTFRVLPHDMLALIHCENDAIVSNAIERLVGEGKTGWRYHAQSRPPEAEQEAVSRVLHLATLGKANAYIVHCSDATTIEHILQNQHYQQQNANGLSLFFETCPQYFTLDTSYYEREHPEHFILQPPLRSAASVDRMRYLCLNVDVISTDHCDYTLAQKQEIKTFAQTPGGLPGLQTSLQLTYTTLNHLPSDVRMQTIVEKMATAPARIFGLYPRKGTLSPGSDADIVIYDPHQHIKLSQNDMQTIGGYSPYEGINVHGAITVTISRGQIILQNGVFSASRGRGRFLVANSFSR